MRIHNTILWSIQAQRVRKDLHRAVGMSAGAFRRHWTAGGASAFFVASIRHDITNMVEGVEVWLRVRVREQMLNGHGEGWWSALPTDIRRRADRRYLVACEEFGKRRAGPAHSNDWLSFGDLLKLLATFTQESWRQCLDSTVAWTPRAHRILAGIKSFRDARVAHLQSGGPTPSEIRRLLGLIDQLCEVLRPQDYVLSTGLRRVLSGISGEPRQLLMQAYTQFRTPRPGLASRLRTLDRILPASGKGSEREVELCYCDALIREADAAGGTDGTLFSDA